VGGEGGGISYGRSGKSKRPAAEENNYLVNEYYNVYLFSEYYMNMCEHGFNGRFNFILQSSASEQENN